MRVALVFLQTEATMVSKIQNTKPFVESHPPRR
jgi:hypothetical protein